MSDTVEVKTFWGCRLVTVDSDDADMKHRWWFSVTDDGKWVLCAEIIDADGDTRHYVPSDEMHLPETVETHLADEVGVEQVHRVGDVT